MQRRQPASAVTTPRCSQSRVIGLLRQGRAQAKVAGNRCLMLAIEPAKLRLAELYARAL